MITRKKESCNSGFRSLYRKPQGLCNCQSDTGSKRLKVPGIVNIELKGSKNGPHLHL